MLHVGSAIGILAYFWRDWVQIVAALFRSIVKRKIETPTERLAWLLVIATIPAGLLGLVLEHPLRVVLAKPAAAACFLMVNGVILLAAERLRRRSEVARPGDAGRRRPVRRSRSLDALGYKEAAVIGVAQSTALIAGISRDGVCMTAGLVRGLDHEDSARFAFLLATPIILAAGVLKVSDLTGPLGNGVRGQALVAAACAAVAAFFSVGFLVKYFRTRTLTPFGIYCVLFGAAMAIYVAVKLTRLPDSVGALWTVVVVPQDPQPVEDGQGVLEHGPHAPQPDRAREALLDVHGGLEEPPVAEPARHHQHLEVEGEALLEGPGQHRGEHLAPDELEPGLGVAHVQMEQHPHDLLVPPRVHPSGRGIVDVRQRMALGSEHDVGSNVRTRSTRLLTCMAGMSPSASMNPRYRPRPWESPIRKRLALAPVGAEVDATYPLRHLVPELVQRIVRAVGRAVGDDDHLEADVLLAQGVHEIGHARGEPGPGVVIRDDHGDVEGRLGVQAGGPVAEVISEDRARSVAPSSTPDACAAAKAAPPTTPACSSRRLEPSARPAAPGFVTSPPPLAGTERGGGPNPASDRSSGAEVFEPAGPRSAPVDRPKEAVRLKSYALTTGKEQHRPGGPDTSAP